jgi:predicted O-linked N-acetylglucosamine transferase (SPINDLY family)
MKILHRVPDGVLWLLADNTWAADNLVREAQVRGIPRERLVFAQRVAPENYLAQYGCADLFLDTFPFNAGTTANDCLWMGCPLLTLSGRSFASRMAGALLTAAGLPELITFNLTDYVDAAVALARDTPKMQQLRDKLQSVQADGALFDTPLFVRNLETKLKALVHQLDEPGSGPDAP